VVSVVRRASTRGAVACAAAVAVLAALLLPIGAASAAASPPASFRDLPKSTKQVVRVVRTNEWCRKAYCTRVEAWQKDAGGRWGRVLIGGKHRWVRSQIGPHGFAPKGRKRAGDGRTPTGRFGITTTFSTDAENPGTTMPWKQRKATSNVTDYRGRYYNTWIEEKGRTNGDRPAMRYGFWVRYNNPRLVPGQGKAPVQGRGSGIFFHAVNPADPYGPSEGCIMTRAGHMRWLVTWLDKGSNPRVVLNG
jgi:L,D-peptidoglycan transpeptidase YkuD (ErfK/YbiS/YcfS/YnhG family)